MISKKAREAAAVLTPGETSRSRRGSAVSR